MCFVSFVFDASLKSSCYHGNDLKRWARCGRGTHLAQTSTSDRGLFRFSPVGPAGAQVYYPWLGVGGCVVVVVVVVGGWLMRGWLGRRQLIKAPPPPPPPLGNLHSCPPPPARHTIPPLGHAAMVQSWHAAVCQYGTPICHYTVRIYGECLQVHQKSHVVGCQRNPFPQLLHTAFFTVRCCNIAAGRPNQTVQMPACPVTKQQQQRQQQSVDFDFSRLQPYAGELVCVLSVILHVFAGRRWPLNASIPVCAR